MRIAALLRSTRWTLPAAGLAAALLAAAPGLAHETWKEPGHVYLRAGVNAEYVNLPEVEAFIDGGLEPVGQTDDTFWAEGLHAVLGFVDTSGMNLPDPIGQNARIEARVSYLHGDADATETDLASAGFFIVDDPGLAALAIVPVDALYESDLESWEADLLYQTDVPLCDRVVFSPLVGFTYTRLDLDNEFKTAAGGLLLPLSVKDDMTTDYYGLALGGDLVARPVDFLEIRLGVRADLMGADADFGVDQQVGLTTIDESDDDVDFAARATTSLGVTLRIRRLELGVEGYARYLSYLPVAEHPVSSSDSPSRIDDEDLWGMGWKARIGFWF